LNKKTVRGVGAKGLTQQKPQKGKEKIYKGERVSAKKIVYFKAKTINHFIKIQDKAEENIKKHKNTKLKTNQN